MNEEEVIIAKETLEALFSDSTGEDYPYTEKFGQAVNIGIQALEELEQYRALGTVEEIKKKIKTELPYMSLAQARFKSELDEYRNIGTVEELKEAREKQVAKKPIDNGMRSGIFATHKYYTCPRCGNVCLQKMANERQNTNYCWDCGQALKCWLCVFGDGK